MKKDHQSNLGKHTKWAMGALGVVLAYFGAFALLMYPVLEAASRQA